MGRILNLDDYRQSQTLIGEPEPDLTDEQIMEFVERGPEGVKEAMKYEMDNAFKAQLKKLKELFK